MGFLGCIASGISGYFTQQNQFSGGFTINTSALHGIFFVKRTQRGATKTAEYGAYCLEAL